MRVRRTTATSNFGVGARESHDASAFYDRFRAPDLSPDDRVRCPEPVSEPRQFVSTGHRLPEHGRVIATPILGGLHHEYHLAKEAA